MCKISIVKNSFNHNNSVQTHAKAWYATLAQDLAIMVAPLVSTKLNLLQRRQNLVEDFIVVRQNHPNLYQQK